MDLGWHVCRLYSVPKEVSPLYLVVEKTSSPHEQQKAPGLALKDEEISVACCHQALLFYSFLFYLFPFHYFQGRRPPRRPKNSLGFFSFSKVRSSPFFLLQGPLLRASKDRSLKMLLTSRPAYKQPQPTFLFSVACSRLLSGTGEQILFPLFFLSKDPSF